MVLAIGYKRSCDFVDIMMEDFDVNGLDASGPLSDVLAVYNQIIQKSSQISRSILNHVYLQNCFLR